jgi:translation initiation factor 4A
MDKSFDDKSFDDLNLNDKLLRGIFSYGFENPSPIQCKSIPIINEGKDLIAQAQSGTGKTGSFAMGVLNNIDFNLKYTQAIVISPTHELANQTFNVFKDLSQYMDISLLKMIGKTSIKDSIDELRKSPQVIIGTPGRILDMINRRYLFTNKLKILIFDEADEILSLGFRDSIYNLVSYIPKDTQICLFSATIPDDILELSEKFLNNPESILIKKEELSLDGIVQFYIKLYNNDMKYDVLKDIYNTFNISQCIIYLNSKVRMININDNLVYDGFPSACIHGDLTSNERSEIIDKFRSGKLRILLSTDLLSRGIDIQQLSLVINYDLPINLETYIHRIGRSGRYGRKGLSINFLTNRDDEKFNNLKMHYDIEINEMPENMNDYLNI